MSDTARLWGQSRRVRFAAGYAVESRADAPAVPGAVRGLVLEGADLVVWDGFVAWCDPGARSLVAAVDEWVWGGGSIPVHTPIPLRAGTRLRHLAYYGPATEGGFDAAPCGGSLLGQWAVALAKVQEAIDTLSAMSGDRPVPARLPPGASVFDMTIEQVLAEGTSVALAWCVSARAVLDESRRVLRERMERLGVGRVIVEDLHGNTLRIPYRTSARTSSAEWPDPPFP